MRSAGSARRGANSAGYFDRAFGLGEAAGAAAFGAGSLVALAALSQLQACASRERTSETLPRLNSASYGVP